MPNWEQRVEDALTRIELDNWTFPAEKYCDIIDDVVAGDKNVEELASVHGASDLVETALGHVTVAIHGSGKVPPIEQGGWYERKGNVYNVAPEFVAAWLAKRG